MSEIAIAISQAEHTNESETLDSQIHRLLDDLRDERWKFAIQLCAMYGLRPKELKYLRIKDRAKEKGGEALRTHLRRGNVWNVHARRQK